MQRTSSPDSGGSAPVAEASEKARTVLRAARAIFLTHGFSAATTDMIQREANVSKSTVYSHYANKEALFFAVIDAECAASVQTVRAIEYRPGELRKTLMELGRAYLDIALSQTGLALFRVVVAEAPRFPELARKFYLTGPRVISGMVAEVLSKAEAAGEIDLNELGREASASVFVNLVRGEPHLECLTHPNSTPSDAQIDHWMNAALTTFMRAYGRRV